MNKGNTVSIRFNRDELLNIMDWFNGYCFKYYGLNPDVISESLPENHKLLINRILEAEEKATSVMNIGIND